MINDSPLPSVLPAAGSSVRRNLLLCFRALALCAIIASPAICGTTCKAQAPSPPAGQETNIQGVVADVTECRSKDGVLSVKIRLRNTSDGPVEFNLIENRNYDDFYVTAGSKKFFILRDTERDPLAVGADGFGYVKVALPKGGTFTWWAKYPAPPDGTATINYIMPIAAPFEDVPVTR